MSDFVTLTSFPDPATRMLEAMSPGLRDAVLRSIQHKRVAHHAGHHVDSACDLYHRDADGPITPEEIEDSLTVPDSMVDFVDLLIALARRLE